MADKKKKAKKVRTIEQDERNFRIFYTIVYPFYNLFFPIKPLHRDRIPEGGCILCPNHTSLKDPPIACFVMTKKNPLHIMAKKSLMEIPILGKIFEMIGTFGVDRGNNDMGAIKNAMRVLKNGRKLLMFPEGTRVSEGEEGSAKTGAVVLATKMNVPVIPMFIPRKKRLFRRTPVVVGEPYMIQLESGRSKQEAMTAAADDLLNRIYALEEETK
jgi:1-acyl-sn-glycerol-3-phosphate acyltransferase